MTQSHFFTNWYLDLIKNTPSFAMVKSPKLKTFFNIKDINEARKDAIALYIYYDDNTYTFIEETPASNLVSLLSTYGKIKIICFFSYINSLIFQEGKLVCFWECPF